MKDKGNYIVIISSVPFPYGNASVNTIYTYLNGFMENDCDGEVLCLFPNLPRKYSNISPSGTYLGVKYQYLLGKTQKSNCKIINYLDKNFRTGYHLRNYLERKSKNYNLTVVFFMHVSKLFFKYSRICRSFKAQIIYTGCEYPEYLVDNSIDRIRKYIKYSSNIDKYIFETRTLENYEKSILERQIDSIVIPATMPFEDIIQCRKASNEPYIAYTGSIFDDSKDGLSNIIKAFSLFKNRHENVKLKFIGRISRQNYFEDLKRLVDQLRLTDSISFTGEVSREDYLEQMVNATVMIVAKPVNSYYSGGLSSKVIEYLFSGNPIIMVAADDYVHYLTHKENVYFTKDNEPESLCNALLELFDDISLRKSIAENGRKFAMENFNYHSLTKRLLTYILQ